MDTKETVLYVISDKGFGIRPNHQQLLIELKQYYGIPFEDARIALHECLRSRLITVDFDRYFITQSGLDFLLASRSADQSTQQIPINNPQKAESPSTAVIFKKILNNDIFKGLLITVVGGVLVFGITTKSCGTVNKKANSKPMTMLFDVNLNARKPLLQRTVLFS